MNAAQFSGPEGDVKNFCFELSQVVVQNNQFFTFSGPEKEEKGTPPA